MLDLDFDLQGAFLVAGSGGDFGGDAVVVLGFGVDLAALAEGDFGEVGFVRGGRCWGFCTMHSPLVGRSRPAMMWGSRTGPRGEIYRFGWFGRCDRGR